MQIKLMINLTSFIKLFIKNNKYFKKLIGTKFFEVKILSNFLLVYLENLIRLLERLNLLNHKIKYFHINFKR
jgi:hypothetical protein